MVRSPRMAGIFSCLGVGEKPRGWHVEFPGDGEDAVEGRGGDAELDTDDGPPLDAEQPGEALLRKAVPLA